MTPKKIGVQFVAEAVGEFVADINKAEKAVEDFGDKGSQSVKASENIFIGAYRRIGAAAVDFAVEGAKAIGGFVSDSVKQAGDFESGMLSFQSVANLDTTGLEQFKSLFISLGKELPVSTSEVQQAATELVKGGIDPATVAAGGLKTSLQFAAAGNLDLAQAAEIGAKTVGGWTATTASAADKAAFMASSMDLMSKAANASTVDVDELALGLYNVQGTAKAAGVGFDDTVTTLAAVSSSFNSASEAGTSMKNFIVRLQPSTKPATEAMKELGLYTDATGSAFYDANGKFVGMQQASALLQNALAGATDAQKVQALQTIFGNDAMGVASKLTELGAAGYANMAQQIAAQAGVQETAALKQQGFNTALDNFHGSIEALQITIGSAVIPVLTFLLNNVLAPGVNTITTFADAISGNTDAFAQLPAPLQSVVTVIQAAATAAGKAAEAFKTGGLSGAVSAFGDSIKNINPTIGGLISSIAPLADTVQNSLGQAMQFASEHSAEFQGALTAIGAVLAGAAIAAGIAAVVGAVASLASPIGIVVGAVALLGAAWAGNWGNIQGITASVWAAVQPVLSQLVTWLQTNIPVAVQAVSQFWTGTLQPAFNQVVQFIQANVMPMLNTLTTVALAQLKAEVQAGAAIWTGVLQPALSAVWSFISGSVIPLIQALYGVEFAALKLAITTVSGIVTGVIVPALKDLWQGFTDLIAPITNSKEALGAAQTAGDLAKGAMNALSGAVGWLIGKLGEFISALKQAADWLNSLRPPDWLVGHSPPPMAYWFADIADSTMVAVEAFQESEQALRDLGDTGSDNVKKLIDEIINLEKESLQAASDMAELASANIGYVFGLGDTSDQLRDQQRLTDENKKNLEQQQELKTEIQKNQQLMTQATDEGSQTYYYDQLVEQQQQLNDLQTEYNTNQTKIQEDQQTINQITQLTADAQQELADAQAQAAKYAEIDAKLGQDYYKMQSDYIQNLNDLKKKQIESQSSDEYQMYQQQIDLLNQQHDANTQLFDIEAEQRAAQLQQVSDDADKLAGEMDDIGNTVAEGVARGIADQTYNIAKAITDAIMTGIEQSQAELEISSPSKVAAKMLGKPTAQGIAMGIDKNSGDVASALSYAMTEPIASTSQILNSNSGNSYSNATSYYYSPTYAAAPKAPQQDFYLMKAGLLPV